MAAKDNMFETGDAKYLIEIESPGFDPARDEFEVILKKGSIQKTYNKSDLVEEIVEEGGQEKHNYYLCLESSDFGKGTIVAVVRAHVPDSDFEKGTRDEVTRFELTNVNAL